MTDAVRLGRRAFTIAVVGATIAWSIGLAAMLQPLAAHGASAGDLVKGSLPAVYYYGGDGKRYVFPNPKTYNTWYSDFSGVMTLSDSEIAAIPIGGNITYRAGTRLMKIQTDPRVYAVELDGVIRWVESEAVASALYGADWASRVDDVADVFFTDYTPGTSLADASMYPAGSLVKNAADPDVYYIAAGGVKRWVDPAAMAGNHFWDANVLTTSQNLSVYSDGANIASTDSVLVDSSQQGGVVTTPSGGGLTVSVSSATPAPTTAAQGASSVGLTAWDFRAGSGDVTVTSVETKRFGVGATTDFANCYLYDSASRLTDGRTVNSQTQVITFSGLSWTIASGATSTLWLKCDIATAPGTGSHGFQLASASAVTSDASSVAGTFPASGNVLTIGSASAGTLTIDATGTVPNPTLGQTDAEIGRFTVAAATEDATIQSMIFRIDGSVRGADLTNFKLKQGTSLLATTASTTADGKYVKFVLDDAFVLENGFTRTMSITADIGGDASRTIGIRAEYPADITAIGSIYGQGMRAIVIGYNGGTADDATRAACSATGQDCSWSTIQGSTLTFVNNGPSSTNYPTNSQDNLFLSFAITAQQYTRIDEFGVIVAADTTSGSGADADEDAGDLIRGTDSIAAREANLKDIKIRLKDGGTVMGPQELTLTGSDITQTLTFTEDLTLQAGETRHFEITADVDNNATAADVFDMAIDVSSIVAEDENGDSIAVATSIVPSADMVGNNMTIRAASLTVTHTSPPSDGASQTTIRGTSNKDSVAFAFTAGQGADITVTSLTLSTYVDGDTTTDVNDFIEGTETEADGGATIAATSMISSVSIYDSETGTLIAGPKNVRSSPAGNVVFDNFEWIVGAGMTKKLVARANIANYTIAGEADAYAFRIDAAADVTAQDADGSTVGALGLGSGVNGTGAAPTTFVQLDNSGTIAISLHSDTPRADIVLAGATDVTMAKFRFDATNEAFKVTKFRIQETGATNNGGSAGDNDNNILSVKVSYPKADGSTATATSFLVAGNADFTLTTDEAFYVPANGNATLTAMASYQTIDNGATRGEKPQFEFDSTNAADFETVGVSSGATLTGTGIGDSEANRMVLRETMPTISIASGNPTSGSAGEGEVLRFSVAASAGESAALGILTFKIATSDANGDSGDAGLADEWNVCDEIAGDEPSQQLATSAFTVYETVDGSSVPLEAANSEWALLALDGSTCTDDTERVGFARLTLATPEMVPAGTTKTYSLQVDTRGASTSPDDTFQASMPADTIVSTWLNSGELVNDAAFAIADTTFTADAGTGFAVGDYLCFDEDTTIDGDATPDGACDSFEEISFVTGISGATITVYRGDLGRAPEAISDNAAILRLPASIVWDDDGAAANQAALNEVSSYRVQNLGAVVGNVLTY